MPGILSVGRLLGGSILGGAFSPAALFASGEQGVWYDPSDMTTLFQDSAGTTPVTAVEQPVGLVLDKSKGLVLGSELVTNGAFDADSDWTKSDGASISGGVLTLVSNGVVAPGAAQTISFTSGVTYQITYTVTRYSGVVGVRVLLTGGTNRTGVTRTTTGTFTEVLVGGGNTTLNIVGLNAFSTNADIDNISVKELPGNHATQSTPASRPVLRARYNLLTYSEQFDNAAWTKPNSSVDDDAMTDPLGGSTADKLLGTAATTVHSAYIQLTVTASTQYTLSFYAKAAELNWITLDPVYPTVANNITYFDLQNGVVGTNDADNTASITDAGGGWYRCQVTHTTAVGQTLMRFQIALANADGGISFLGSASEGVYIWGADLRVTNDGVGLPAYQRIAAATDYDTVGFPPYLLFDGSDDSLATAAIDFSATDEMSVFAGVRKLSDAASGCVVETSATSALTDGTFTLFAPSNTGLADYFFRSRGSAGVGVTAPTNYAAPITNVMTGLADISADSLVLRANGAQIATAATDQGTGNYTSQIMYIGSRAGSSIRFNGRLYSLIVRGKTSTADEITAAETWVNGKTKAFL